MPFLTFLLASASLLGAIKVLYDAIQEDLADPEDSKGDAENSPTASMVVHEESQESPDLTTSSMTEFERGYHRFIRNTLDPLFGSTLGPYERQINLNIGISAALTAAALITARLSPLIRLVVNLPPTLYILKDVYKAAYKSLAEQHKVTLPVLGAVNVTTVWLGGYYLTGGVILTLVHLGMKLSFITENRSRKRLVSIFGQQPQQVFVLCDGVEVEVPIEKLRAGDIVVVSAGQTVAVDGVIVKGSASIDQRVLTGESQPAEKGAGDKVLAATIVLRGRIAIRAEKAGHETAAAKIGEMLKKTAGYQMAIISKAERIANASVMPTLLAAGGALLTVGYSGMAAITSTIFGFNLMICGPLALLTYLEVAARHSILIKDGRSLEVLNTIDTIVFDKTGTLTLEQPHVKKVYTFAGLGPSEVLRYAATVEQRQSHPIARAILAYAKEHAVPLSSIAGSRYEMGYGLCAEIDGKLIRVGSERFMAHEQIRLPPEALRLQKSCQALGHSLVLLAMGDELLGAIELQPTLRKEAKSVVTELRRRGLDIYIISGDEEGPTRQLAETLGIDNYLANTLPENKAQEVERLQRSGRAVCFVGDGINDSIALKKANVSVSLSGATSVAMDTAQVVLMDSTLQQLPLLFQLAEEMDKNLKTSLALAIVPGLGIWMGVFFGGLGVLGASVIYEASTWVGIANALRPRFTYRQPLESPDAGPTMHALPEST